MVGSQINFSAGTISGVSLLKTLAATLVGPTCKSNALRRQSNVTEEHSTVTEVIENLACR